MNQKGKESDARSGHMLASSARTAGWSAALHPPPMLVQVTTDCVNAGVAQRQVVFVLSGRWVSWSGYGQWDGMKGGEEGRAMWKRD